MNCPPNEFPAADIWNYSDLRAHIASGDLLLCAGTSLMSTMIQNATQSVWSHVAFILRLDAIDRIMILESVESIGVRTVALSSYVNMYNGTRQGYPGRLLIARHRAFDSTRIADLSQHAIDLFGYPYNKQEILRIAARIGMHAFGFTPNSHEIKPQREFICSEYVQECYRSIGLTVETNREGFIAPADFACLPETEAVGYVRVE
jgi:hypothetical protein